MLKRLDRPQRQLWGRSRSSLAGDLDHTRGLATGCGLRPSTNPREREILEEQKRGRLKKRENVSVGATMLTFLDPTSSVPENQTVGNLTEGSPRPVSRKASILLVLPEQAARGKGLSFPLPSLGSDSESAQGWRGYDRLGNIWSPNFCQATSGHPGCGHSRVSLLLLLLCSSVSATENRWRAHSSKLTPPSGTPVASPCLLQPPSLHFRERRLPPMQGPVCVQVKNDPAPIPGAQPSVLYYHLHSLLCPRPLNRA